MANVKALVAISRLYCLLVANFSGMREHKHAAKSPVFLLKYKEPIL